MVERAPKRQKLTLRGVVLDDSLLTDYAEATDTPPPLPLDLGEARKAQRETLLKESHAA